MKLASSIATLFLRTLHATLRMRHVRAENIENAGQHILAFWHQHLLLMFHSRFRKPIKVMISRSKDGEYVAGVVHAYGAETARGSTTRGGAMAMRELLRDARDGKNLAFTPDGPKGPARVVQAGVVSAAQLTGLPIVPVAFAAKKRKLLRSWDRMIIPLPFSKALFLYGEPFAIPREGDAEEWRLRLEETMNTLADEAERLVMNE